MGRPNANHLAFGPLRGMDQVSNPLVLGTEYASDALNVELVKEGRVAVKRFGTTVDATAPLGLLGLHRHLGIGASETVDAELWGWKGTATAPPLLVYRRIGSGAWNPITVPATLTSITRCVSFNGKIFFAGTTAGVNRMHVWDGTSIRLSGLSGGVGLSAPTVTNGGPGGGTYPAILRYYKIDQRIIVANATQVRSEPGLVASFTPDGGSLSARVTRPALGAAATHWVVWGSADNVTFYQLAAPIPAATTFYDDTVIPSAYNAFNGVLPEPIGTFMPLPAATRIITDGHRLLMSGNGSGLTVAPNSSELAVRGNRVWYTPVLGTLDQGDDERIVVTLDQRNYIDIGENLSANAITELGGPMDGQVYCFNLRRVWRLVPTGDVITPYLVYPVTDKVGAMARPLGVNICAVTGEDEHGQPALYFLSTDGVYRLSNNNLQFVSYEVQVTVGGAIIQPDFSRAFIFANLPKRQLWVHCLGGDWLAFHWDQGRPDEDGDVRGGWVRWQLEQAGFNGHTFAALHNRTPGNGDSLVAYITAGNAETTTQLVRCDSATASFSGGQPYAAWVEYATLLPTNGESRVRAGPPTGVVRVLTSGGAVIEVAVVGDFGVLSEKFSRYTAATGTTIGAFENLFAGDLTALSLRVGDPPTDTGLVTTAYWEVWWLTVPLFGQEPR